MARLFWLARLPARIEKAPLTRCQRGRVHELVAAEVERRDQVLGVAGEGPVDVGDGPAADVGGQIGQRERAAVPAPRWTRRTRVPAKLEPCAESADQEGLERMAKGREMNAER